MRSVSIGFVFFIACVVGAIAQEHPAAVTDPRVGLKAGIRDAGVAARNLELIKSIPKPEGFFDPKSPLGTPTPAEQSNAPAAQQPAQQPTAQQPAAQQPTAQQPASQQPAAAQPPAQPPSGIDFANSDIA